MALNTLASNTLVSSAQQSLGHIEALITAERFTEGRLHELEEIEVVRREELPQSVREKLCDRERTGLGADVTVPSLRQLRGRFRIFLAVFVFVYGFDLLVVTGPVGARLDTPPGALIGSVVGTFLMVVALIWAEAAYRSMCSDPLLLSARERRLVSVATEWVGWWGLARTLPPREAAMVLVAQDVINSIRTSPAWLDESLELHRVRLDLDEERRQITRSAFRLSRFTGATFALDVNENDPVAARVQAALDQRTALVGDMRRAVLERVAALHRYREGLRPVEALLRNIEVVRTLDAEQEDLAAAYTDIVRNEQGATDLRRLSDELAELEAGLLARIDYLRTNAINDAGLDTPLALA